MRKRHKYGTYRPKEYWLKKYPFFCDVSLQLIKKHRAWAKTKEGKTMMENYHRKMPGLDFDPVRIMAHIKRRDYDTYRDVSEKYDEIRSQLLHRDPKDIAAEYGYTFREIKNVFTEEDMNNIVIPKILNLRLSGFGRGDIVKQIHNFYLEHKVSEICKDIDKEIAFMARRKYVPLFKEGKGIEQIAKECQVTPKQVKFATRLAERNDKRNYRLESVPVFRAIGYSDKDIAKLLGVDFGRVRAVKDENLGKECVEKLFNDYLSFRLKGYSKKDAEKLLNHSEKVLSNLEDLFDIEKKRKRFARKLYMERKTIKKISEEMGISQDKVRGFVNGLHVGQKGNGD